MCLLLIGLQEEKFPPSRTKHHADHVGHSQQSETLKSIPEFGMTDQSISQNKS